MARKKIIAGNWKMNMTPSQAVELVNTLKPLVVNDEVDVVFCVPAIDLVPVMEATKGTNIQVGAENMYFEDKGAYTGEIAPAMLTDIGVKYVIIGHSERREYFAETDETVNKKVLKAFEYGLTPIICCGETLTQREQGITLDWIRQQIKIAFQNVTAEQAASAVIAYEPIWAIGTGKVATTEQAQEVCGAIRACIAEVYDEATAAAIRTRPSPREEHNSCYHFLPDLSTERPWHDSTRFPAKRHTLYRPPTRTPPLLPASPARKNTSYSPRRTSRSL